ncbi:MAG: ABC transporter permease [Desulfobacteraceae bacterium]|nr:ABC transporter permease [Desulfobacteraceae bacterium]
MRFLIEFMQFIKALMKNRKLLMTLAVNDFKQEYLGSYLGLVWAFIKPTVFIVVIWFVFEIGIRSAPSTNGVPFVIWLTCGFAAWFFFSEALSSGVTAISSKSYLVKKVDFRVSILPIINNLSALLIHVIFLMILVIIFLCNDYFPTVYWLQLPFYTFSLFTLLLGLNWLFASLRVFIKDISPFVGIILQVGFWGTPLFWSIDLVPDKYLFIIKLNPMYFIVSGYRDTFISEQWFWNRGMELVVFWMITSFFFILGAIVFKRLRPHFGDVL